MEQSTVTVHALSAGFLTLPERFFVTPASSDARCTVPSLCFLIQHTCPTTHKTTRIVFDLGLRKDISTYSAPIRTHCSTRQPMTTEPDVVASLAEGGLTPEDIDWVVFSHVHYDHIGTPDHFQNSRTRFIVGPGSLGLLDGTKQLHVGSHSFFERDLLPLHRTIELSDPSSSPVTESPKPWSWNALPPFPNAINFFGDSTVFLVHAPGHLPGHLNLLARVSSSRFIYLAGDACHDVRLFTGDLEIATWTDDEGRNCCIHADLPAAKETLRRLRNVAANGITIRADREGDEETERKGRAEVEVVFAHNWAWEQDARAKGRFWPGRL